ncbi:hypothetical protein C0Q70_10507 [Pomacea canaliculata]|uniref:Uncharacterized protein n=1 Tax=Pomacea canaliculata TaxID=400727 RepID=A0A2T7P3E1_POMCA|nr:hypothetical protein C0Q70_10507 [Pomacea canaliculata]
MCYFQRPRVRWNQTAEFFRLTQRSDWWGDNSKNSRAFCPTLADPLSSSSTSQAAKNKEACGKKHLNAQKEEECDSRPPELSAFSNQQQRLICPLAVGRTNMSSIRQWTQPAHKAQAARETCSLPRSFKSRPEGWRGRRGRTKTIGDAEG